jgi:hypothetical protein
MLQILYLFRCNRALTEFDIDNGVLQFSQVCSPRGIPVRFFLLLPVKHDAQDSVFKSDNINILSRMLPASFYQNFEVLGLMRRLGVVCTMCGQRLVCFAGFLRGNDGLVSQPGGYGVLCSRCVHTAMAVHFQAYLATVTDKTNGTHFNPYDPVYPMMLPRGTNLTAPNPLIPYQPKYLFEYNRSVDVRPVLHVLTFSSPFSKHGSTVCKNSDYV